MCDGLQVSCMHHENTNGINCCGHYLDIRDKYLILDKLLSETNMKLNELPQIEN